MHIPVLLTETITALDIKPGRWYVDATFGRGGHTREILKLGAKVVAFDFDEEAIKFGENEFSEEIARADLILIRANFDQMKQTIDGLKSASQIGPIEGILFDFGTSSEQLTSPTRGFSFFSQAELDMRMDQRLGVKAKDLLQLLSQKDLIRIFRDLGGEKEAVKIARAIVADRENPQLPKIDTTAQLAELVCRVKQERGSHLHPATKVFQALRMVVNTEVDNIVQALPQAVEILEPGGRLVTISFHEGEDGLVKKAWRDYEKQHLGISLTKKPITASAQEQMQNPRSRSAKMRIWQKAEK